MAGLAALWRFEIRRFEQTKEVAHFGTRRLWRALFLAAARGSLVARSFAKAAWTVRVPAKPRALGDPSRAHGLRGRR